MIKSPITNQGKIQYIELIKISILIGFLYAFVSSVLEANMQVILLSSSLLSGIAFVLGFFNIVLLTISFLDELKTYVDQKLYVWLDEILLPCFKQIQKQFVNFIHVVFVMDIHSKNMVCRC